MSDVSIRPLDPRDETAWHPLFAGYRSFYGQPDDAEKQRTVWHWLMDASHPLCGMVATDTDGALLGLAHWLVWPSTLGAADVGYLSDLFVDPSARGRRVGKQLYVAVVSLDELLLT